MHKLYLTDSEVSIIEGAEPIIAEFGGFPSMENGTLCSVDVKTDRKHFDVTLLFDIKRWHEVSSSYFDNLPSFSHRYIELLFHHADDVTLARASLGIYGEIKFENTHNTNNWRMPSLPYRPLIVDRPFCAFHIRRDLRIYFNEEACRISAIAKDER